jgi:hypothetical protein
LINERGKTLCTLELSPSLQISWQVLRNFSLLILIVVVPYYD